MNDQDLARPFAPHRLRAYAALGILTGIVGTAAIGGTSTRLLEPTMALDVVVNILTFLPMVLMPLTVYWTGHNERRSEIQKASELTLVWLPFTVAAQMSFELVWWIGQLYNIWQPVEDPGWQWMWWQFALTDTRYFGENTAIFGIETTAILGATIALAAFRQLIRVGLSDATRIRHLWLATVAMTVLTATTVIYFVSALRNGLADLGQGTYGLIKFFALNGPYLVVPFLVLDGMRRQIEFLAKRGPASPS